MLDRTYTNEVTSDDSGEEVAVAGWAHEIRDLGGITFVILRDRKGQIQVIFKEDEDEELFNKAQDIGKEDLVHVKGVVEENDQAPGDREIQPTSLEIIGEAESPLPMDVSKNIDSDLSTRLDNRFMDLRRPEVHAVFSLKTKAMEAMQEWFDEDDYIEIDTPLISKGGAEGGAELFPVIY
ncbi:MAG: OB-fold nucleic acid binding domain-containing protein, partial [Candidatus Nanohalobium sp.]